MEDAIYRRSLCSSHMETFSAKWADGAITNHKRLEMAAGGDNTATVLGKKFHWAK